MTDKAIRALQFVRLVDADGQLSLTNIALLAALAKVLMAPQLATADLAAFIATIFSYQFKRWNQPAAPAEDTKALADAVASLQTKVVGLQISAQQRPR